MIEFLYTSEGNLDVKVIAEEGYGYETQLIIDSLKGALESAIRADERFRVTLAKPRYNLASDALGWR